MTNEVKLLDGSCQDMQDVPASFPHLKRDFEVYDIEWLIEPFNLATCSEKWLIQSPELVVRGSNSSKWLMTLESGEDQNDVPVFHLQRCNFGTGPVNINAEWRLNMSVANQDFYGVDRFCIFKKGTLFKQPLRDFNHLFETLNSAELMTLAIKCILILYNDNIGNEFESNHEGINCLSSDLLLLSRTGNRYDLTLKFDDNIIKAHKAILSTRIPEMFKNKCDERNEIDLSALKYEAMLCIIDYVYSGDLRHVLWEPTLAISDCIEILDIRRLKKYYEPKKLTFRSTMKFHEFQIRWEITNFYNESAFQTPVILDDCSRTWQLLFSPNEDEDENQSDYFSIFLESTGETKPTSLFLEFAITDKQGMILFERKLRSSINDLNKVGFEKFIRRGLLRNFAKINGNVYLRIKIRLSHDTVNSSIDRYDVSVVSNINELNSFDLLSFDMRMLYDNPDFSDVTFRFKNVSFRLHRCVLAARSSYFSNLLDNETSNVITLTGTELDLIPDTAFILFLYLYTGILGTDIHEILQELRTAALTCQLPVLEEMCDNALRENLENN